MAETLEVTLRLNDRFSNVLKRVATNLSQFREQITRMSRLKAFTNLSVSINEVRRATEGLKGSLSGLQAFQQIFSQLALPKGQATVFNNLAKGAQAFKAALDLLAPSVNAVGQAITNNQAAFQAFLNNLSVSASAIRQVVAQNQQLLRMFTTLTRTTAQTVGEVNRLKNALSGLSSVAPRIGTAIGRLGVTTNAARKSVNSLTTDAFRFRDSITAIASPINFIVNSIATMFRRIARLRTAFFILLTVLAVRPIVRFFDTLIDKSDEASQAVKPFRDQLQAIQIQLSRQLAPVFVQVFEQFIKFLKEVSDFVVRNEEEIRDFISLIADVVNVFRLLGVAAIAAFNGIKFSIFVLLETWAEFKANFIADTIQMIERGRQLGGVLGKVSEAVGQAILDIAVGVGKDPFKFIEDARKEAEMFGAKADELEVQWADSVARMTSAWNKFRSNLTQGASDFVKSIQNITIGFFRGLGVAVTETNNRVKSAAVLFEEEMSKRLRRLKLELIEFFLDYTRFIHQIVTGTVTAIQDGLADVLVDVFTNQSKQVKDIVRQLLLDLFRQFIQFAIRMATVKLIAGILEAFVPGGGAGFAVGAGFGSTTQGGSRQEGGTVFGTQMIRAGEVPEAFVPLKKGRIPVTVSGGMQRPVVVNFNVQATDAASFNNQLGRSRREVTAIITAAISGQDAELRGALQRFNKR